MLADLKRQEKVVLEDVKRLEAKIESLREIRERQLSPKLEKEIRYKQRQLEESRKRLWAIKDQVKKNIPNDIVVSDHAVLRYMERKLKLNVQGIRDEVLSEELKRVVDKIGNCTVNGFVVRERTVVTYLE